MIFDRTGIFKKFSLFSIYFSVFVALIFFSAMPSPLRCGESESSYQFAGTHFIASYSECDLAALSDLTRLKEKMKEAVAASGAHLLSSAEHVFPPHGLTMVMLLSESHASIHTYPEHSACFVDLFTCGDHCSYEKFDAVLAQYLGAKKIDRKVWIRQQQTEEKERVYPIK